MQGQREAGRSEAANGPERDYPALEGLTHSRSGVTSFEYGLLVALIAIVVGQGVEALGGSVVGMWTGIADAVISATGG